jgi:hypothetical protein
VLVPWFDCDESLTWARFEFESRIVSFCFLSLFHLENYVCLSRSVQVAGMAWRAATRIMAGVGDLV